MVDDYVLPDISKIPDLPVQKVYGEYLHRISDEVFNQVQNSLSREAYVRRLLAPRVSRVKIELW